MAASESFGINLCTTLESRKASSEASERQVLEDLKFLCLRNANLVFLYEHSLNYTWFGDIFKTSDKSNNLLKVAKT